MVSHANQEENSAKTKKHGKSGDFAKIYHVEGGEIKLLGKSGGAVTFDKSQLALE